MATAFNPETHSPTRDPIPPTQRRVLLLVDDEEEPRQSLRLVFEDTYEVLLAAGGQEAIEWAKRRRIDGAVVDFLMTDMTGTELLGKLKDIDSRIEVIILTGHATLESACQAVKLGACEYLMKPYDVGALRESVARMMDRRSFSERMHASLSRLQSLEAEVESFRSQPGLSPEMGGMLDQLNRPLTLIVGLISILNRRISGVERLEGEAMDDFRERLRVMNREADEIIDSVQALLQSARRTSAPVERAEATIGQALNRIEGLSASLLGGRKDGGPPPTLEDLEREAVVQALKRNEGNKVAAAKELGITRQTLYNKIRSYGIEA